MTFRPGRPGRRPRLRVAVVGTLLTALGTSALVATAPSASAAISIDTSAWYVIVNANSGKALDLYNWSTSDGAEFRQWTRTDAENQQFQLVSSGSGYYRLKNRYSGKVADVWGWSTADGGEINQYTDLNGANQQWSLTGSNNSSVRFINRNSGKAMEVYNWSTSDGGDIAQWTDYGNANQTWQLVQVGSGSSSGGGSTTTTTTTSSSSGGGSSSGCGSGTGDAEVTSSGSTYTARRGSSTVYSGGDFVAAAQAAIDSLTSGRTSNQRVVIRTNGTVPASSRISLRSYTTFESCGTINVTGSGSGDMAPVYARGVNNIAIPYLTVTGSPQYGIFLRSVNNATLGQIDLRLTNGLGVRIDNYGDTSVYSKNIRIDNVYVQGATNHGVETYGVDGLTVGTVTARNVGYSGLILNNTINAEVGTVDADNVATGTGYAAFRMANRNGRVGSSYPTNIHVGQVIARGGGRGVFCVSESGGAVIDRVTLSNNGNNAILVENCYNVTIAAQSGTITGGGEIRISARDEFANTSNVTFQNLTVTNNVIRESPCGVSTIVRNNRLINSSLSICSGSNGGGNTTG